MPAILDALARYRDRIAYVVDDDDFDEKVCDAPISIAMDGRERDVHVTVWITAYGIVCELIDEMNLGRLQLTRFVPIEGGLRPTARSCEKAVRELAIHAADSLQLLEIEFRGRIGP